MTVNFWNSQGCDLNSLREVRRPPTDPSMPLLSLMCPQHGGLLWQLSLTGDVKKLAMLLGLPGMDLRHVSVGRLSLPLSRHVC